MGFLRRLFSGQQPAPVATWPPPGPITSWPVGGTVNLAVTASMFEPDRKGATVEVVGESHYQPMLEYLAGGRTYDGPRIRDQIAVFLPEPSNPYDCNAVRIWLMPQVQGGRSGTIGYLSREDAVAYRAPIDRLASLGKLMACRATVKGGWDRGGGDNGSIGVTLHLDSPGAVLKDIESTNGPDPRWLAPSSTDLEAGGYTGTTCPSCGCELPRPLPKAKKACPGCGQGVYVRTRKGVRHLLTEAAAQKWDQALYG